MIDGNNIEDISLPENSVNEPLRQQIRAMVANIDGLQKERVAQGNRLVAAVYKELGVRPGTSPEDSDVEVASMINMLKKEYDSITQGIAENHTRVKTFIQKNTTNEDMIHNEVTYLMVQSYFKLQESEDILNKCLDKLVKAHPLWDKFFADIAGCGPKMAAICIGYFDVYKAKYPSSFFKYAGLDVVPDKDEYGMQIYLKVIDGETTNEKVVEKIVYVNEFDEIYRGNIRTFTKDGEEYYIGEQGEDLIPQFAMDKTGNPIYTDLTTGEDWIGEVTMSHHARKMGDTEMVDYVDADGVIRQKRSITYNPKLRSKLIGVLAPCLTKSYALAMKNGKEYEGRYGKIYYEIKSRYENSAKYKNDSAAHRHAMALRYMVKQLLRDMHSVWRDLEGLPVYPPYEVAVLGNKPHHLNELQYNLAQKSIKEGRIPTDFSCMWGSNTSRKDYEEGLE